MFAGHAVHILGIRPELYCCMHAIYAFIQAHYQQRRRLWKSGIKEVGWIVQLLPLAFSSPHRQWSTTAFTCMMRLYMATGLSARRPTQSSSVRRAAFVKETDLRIQLVGKSSPDSIAPRCAPRSATPRTSTPPPIQRSHCLTLEAGHRLLRCLSTSRNYSGLLFVGADGGTLCGT